MSKSLSLQVDIYRVIRKYLRDLYVNCKLNPRGIYELSCIYIILGVEVVSVVLQIRIFTSVMFLPRHKIACLLHSNFCNIGNVALKAYFCSLLQSGAAVIFGMLKYISLIVWMT
jgi:hypothetical protein